MQFEPRRVSRNRLGASFVVVIGIAAVVGVLVSVFTMAGSLTGSFIAVGSPDRAIVLRRGANFSEGASMLPLDTAAIVASAPGVARTSEGRGAVTADLVTAVNRPRRSNGTLRALAVRGVGAENFAVRPEIVLVEGRRFTPGLREAIVGRSAQTEFDGLDVGATDQVARQRLDDRGRVHDRRCDRGGADHGRRYTGFGVWRRLRQQRHGAARDARGVRRAQGGARRESTLKVDVYREPDYFVQDAAELDDLFFFVTYVICSIMAAGALVGALNTMYAAVSSRAVEIATLRALGFGATGIVVSVSSSRWRSRRSARLSEARSHGLSSPATRSASVAGRERWSRRCDHAVDANHRSVLGVRRRARRRAVAAVRAARLPLATALRAT